jgi:hypothetical protein
VAKSLKARPPELTTLGLGPVVPSRRQARLAGKGRRGSIHLWLLMPRHSQPGMKLSRQHLDRCWSCSSCPLHDDASSFVAPDRRCKFPPLELWPVCARLGCPRWDVLSSCRFSSSLKGGPPHIARRMLITILSA